MDRIWDYYKINNKKPLSDQAIAEFYSHPVWLMNGIFTSLDPISEKHRDVIARFIGDNDFKLIADYAGGFGELAIKIANKSPDSTIKIIEPFFPVFVLSHQGVRRILLDISQFNYSIIRSRYISIIKE